MARKPRLHLPGGLYHVMLRGNGGQDIFFAAADRARFLELLEEGVERFGHRVHGFCLMTNHVHLVLQAGAAPLSRAMQNLSFRHTRYVNAREKRIGHLFQGRYKALLVDAERYLLELVRYVHLNPLRAGLVDHPAAWPWSGHRAYLGEAALPWLTTDRVLGRFGGRLATARAAYRDFVAAGLGEGHRPEFHLGADDSRVLADDGFVKQVLKRADRQARRSGRAPPTLEAIVGRVAAAYGLEPAALAGPSRGRSVSEARGVAGHLSLAHGAASLSDVAGRFGRELSTMSRVVGRVEARAARDPAFKARLRGIDAAIQQLIQA